MLPGDEVVMMPSTHRVEVYTGAARRRRWSVREKAQVIEDSYGITAHLVCQSFNDVFSKYGDKTPLFDNMHITATFAKSEPTSIEKVTRRAGKALEMRESYSDPRSLFGRAHRSTSQSEQQRYILSEEDVRGLDDRKQFLFVNNTKPILADKIRYYEEPFFKARTGDYFHGVPAAY